MDEATQPSYQCSDQSCLATGTAQEMFNIPCNPSQVTLDELKKRVLCASCAKTYVRETRPNGRHAQAKVFRLDMTLSLLQRFEEERQIAQSWGDDYLRWHLEVSAPPAQRRPRQEIEGEYLEWYLQRNQRKRSYRLPRL